MHNDMSIWDLLLALLLHTAQPKRLEDKYDVWKDLWVREPNEEEPKNRNRTTRKSGAAARKKQRTKHVDAD